MLHWCVIVEVTGTLYIFLCAPQGIWISATKAKLQNAEMPKELQRAEIMIQEHQEIAEDIKAHKPK